MLRELEGIVSMQQVEQRAHESGIDLSAINPEDLRTKDFKGDPLTYPHALLIRVAEIARERHDQEHPFNWRDRSIKIRSKRKDLDL